jgi:hypothetical protein
MSLFGGSRFQTLFSTNNLYIDQSNIIIDVAIWVYIVNTGKP